MPKKKSATGGDTWLPYDHLPFPQQVEAWRMLEAAKRVLLDGVAASSARARVRASASKLPPLERAALIAELIETLVVSPVVRDDDPRLRRPRSPR